MFGYVKNYSWSARPDGGYDCSTTIISIGEILESLKVNFSPQNLKLVEGGSGLIFTNTTQQTIKRYKKNILAGLFSEIYEKVNANNEGSKEGTTFDLAGSNYFILNKELKNVSETEGDDDKLVHENANSKQIYIRLGSLIDILNTKVLLQDPQSKTAVIKFSLKEREFDLTNSAKNPNHELLCLAHPLQLSVDPTICYIKNPTWGNITPPTDDQIDATSGKDISKFSNNDYSKDLADIKTFADSNDASSKNEKGIIDIVKPIAKLGINELSELNSQCLQKYNRTIYSLMYSALNNSEIDQILTEGGIAENSSTYTERKKAIETDFVEELKKKKEETKELAKDAASNSKYLNSNAQNFFLDNKPSLELGIIANIYVNLQFLYSLSLDGSLESQDKKEKQEIAIYDFIKNIMAQISDSIGNVNNFDIHVDPTDNIARIIDINYVDETSRADAYNNAFVLEVQGLNSIVRSYKLESQIFPEQSTMIAIGAQAQGGALGVNSNTLIDFNKNLVDRILPDKIDANTNTENQASAISEQISALEENLKTIYTFLGDTSSYQILFTVPSFDVNSASTYKGALRDIIAYFQSFTKSNSKNRAIIPTKLSVDMDGIGGLVIGHLFRIPENLLPRGYKGENGIGSKLGYIITGISHNLNGKDWTTGIEAQTVILDEPSGADVAFKEILKEATTELVSGNVTEAIKDLNPPPLPKGVEASTQQINAMRLAGNKVFSINGEVPGKCARYSYSIAYWYISALRGKTKDIGKQISAGGNANQKSYRDSLKKLGYTEYDRGSVTKDTIKKELNTYKFGIGDIVIYWTDQSVSGAADEYGHTQIYTGAQLDSSKNVVWASSTGKNYGTSFVYNSVNSNQWYFYIMKAPKS
jgi:hypothetical protein